jgi:magnesium chelatase family protein
VCSPEAVARYRARLSGPLLDRIDLRVEVLPVASAQLSRAPDGETSEAVRERVIAARARQRSRQGVLNAELSAATLHLHATPDAAGNTLLQTVSDRLGWSSRSYHRMLRVARTVADLAGEPVVNATHVAEAIQWRRAGATSP